MRNKKTIIIGVLCTIVAIMTVGYALLAAELNITGTASVDSTWRVELTNISTTSTIGGVTSKETPSYNATTVNFNVGLIQPGDSITYAVEISNLGSLDAKVGNINVNAEENGAITYTTSGVESGQSLPAGESATLYFTIAYNSNITSQPDKTTTSITLTVNCAQDLGTTNEPSTTYDYVIGDVVTFAGSNWYVIKNSTSDEDYVTLLKEKVLTNAELGEYAYYDTYDTMSYYWSDTCHYSGQSGYTNDDGSGCEGHNDYEGSKVKEFLEGTYIDTLGADNLKEIEGYKIRLIKLEELMNDLGYQEEYIVSSTQTVPSENAPSWVYQNFGELSDYSNGVGGYWTMTPHPKFATYVWGVYQSSGLVDVKDVRTHYLGLRPVINLLKSNI